MVTTVLVVGSRTSCPGRTSDDRRARGPPLDHVPPRAHDVSGDYGEDRFSDYVDVAARIRDFRAAHPTGSLRPLDPARPFEVLTIGDRTFVVVVTAAYRTPDDPMPGVGLAWEPFPGRTPYTRDSELMNAQTGSIGRAIVASLAGDTSRVASRDEVRARAADRAAPEPDPADSTRACAALLGRIDGLDRDGLRTLFAETVALQRAGTVLAADADAVRAEITNAAGRLDPDTSTTEPDGQPTGTPGETT